jgi:hypothetical protein
MALCGAPNPPYKIAKTKSHVEIRHFTRVKGGQQKDVAHSYDLKSEPWERE